MHNLQPGGRGNFISEIPSPRWLPAKADDVHLPAFVVRVFFLLDRLPAKANEVYLPVFMVRVSFLLDKLPTKANEVHLPFPEGRLVNGPHLRGPFLLPIVLSRLTLLDPLCSVPGPRGLG